MSRKLILYFVGAVSSLLLFGSNLTAQIYPKELQQFYTSSYQPVELQEYSANRIEQKYRNYLLTKASKNDTVGIDYREFVYSNNYYFEQLNKSGQVFYGDTISQYLNVLKDFLLQEYPQRNYIQVYLTRNATFNAFTNDFGSIYVNIATIAKAKSQEELLAVLAHEISHVLKEHSLAFETFRISSATEWEESDELEVLEHHRFSRVQELEADAFGFQLLKSRGVNLVRAMPIFEALQFDADPALSGDVSLATMVNGDSSLVNFLEQRKSELVKHYLDVRPFKTDSLSTHPEAKERMLAIQLNYDSLLLKHDSCPVSLPLPDHRYFMELSQRVLLESYLESNASIAGLDHVLKLRTEAPADSFLVKAQAKLLLLLTQEKYHGSPYVQFLNDNGSQYRDTAYLEFKELMLSLNELEMNLLALATVRNLKKEHNVIYLLRVEQFLVQFLYKYNKELFVFDGTQLQYADMNSLSLDELKLNMKDPTWNFERYSLDIYDSAVHFGFVPVAMLKNDLTKQLLQQILPKLNIQQDIKHINAFKAKRNKHDSTLTYSKISIDLEEEEDNYNFLNGMINTSLLFDNNEALVGLSPLSFYLQEHASEEITLNYQRTLQYERLIATVYGKVKKFQEHFAFGEQKKKVMMRQLNQNYVLRHWVSEALQDENLFYSTYDEVVGDFSKTNGVNYVYWNMNFVIDKRSDSILIQEAIAVEVERRERLKLEALNKTETIPKVLMQWISADSALQSHRIKGFPYAEEPIKPYDKEEVNESKGNANIEPFFAKHDLFLNKEEPKATGLHFAYVFDLRSGGCILVAQKMYKNYNRENCGFFIHLFWP